MANTQGLRRWARSAMVGRWRQMRRELLDGDARGPGPPRLPHRSPSFRSHHVPGRSSDTPGSVAPRPRLPIVSRTTTGPAPGHRLERFPSGVLQRIAEEMGFLHRHRKVEPVSFFWAVTFEAGVDRQRSLDPLRHV